MKKNRYGRIMETANQALKRKDEEARLKEYEARMYLAPQKPNTKDPQTQYELWDEYCNCTLMTRLEYFEHLEFEEMDAEHRAEMEAENAWLRHAENQVDYGFEQWEHSRLYS